MMLSGAWLAVAWLVLGPPGPALGSKYPAPPPAEKPAAAKPAAAKPAPKAISNYWLHLNEVLEAEAAKPPVRLEPSVRFPPPRTFPFDALADFTPTTLMRAAIEGIRAARESMPTATPAEIERQVEANVQFALEYYPLLVTRDSDIDPLLYAIRDPSEEPMLRVHLLRRIAPGMAPPTGLGDYLQMSCMRAVKDTTEMLETIATSTFETPAPQVVAIEAWYRYAFAQYARLFHGDPAVQAWSAEHKTEAMPALMRTPDAVALAPYTAEAFQRQTEDFARVALALGALLAPESGRPDHVKGAARSVLARLLAEVPLADPAPVKALLEGGPAAAPVVTVND